MKKITNYFLKLKLTNYINARIVEIENDDGIMEKGVFIPIDINGLYVTKDKSVYSTAFATQKTVMGTHISTHYIRHKMTKEQVEKLKEYGYTPPYIGNLRRDYNVYDFQKTNDTKKDNKVSIRILNEKDNE